MIPPKPSFANGFAPRDFEPQYPTLWWGCRFAVAACLGPHGSLSIRDWSNRGGNAQVFSPPAGLVQIDGGNYGWAFNGSAYIGGQEYAGSLTYPISLSCWYRQKAAIVGDGTEDYTIMGLGNSSANDDYFFLSLYRTSSRGECFRALAGQTSAGASHYEVYYTHNTVWHHIAYVWYGSGNVAAYLDGRSMGINTLNGTNTLPQGIGTYGVQGLHRPSPYGMSANMVMDDARVYDRILRQDEVRLLAIRRGIAYDPKIRSRCFIAGAAGEPPLTVSVVN